MLFDVRSQMAQSLASTSARPPTAKSSTARKEKEQDNYAILKFLSQCIEKEGMTSQQLFKMADKNFNGALSIDELKEQVKAMIPDSFGVLNYKKLLKAFDLNGSGIIEEEEFVGLLEMAARSNADVSGYTKIQKALGTGKGGDKHWEQAAEGAYRQHQMRSSEAAHSVTLDQMVLPEDRVNPDMVKHYMQKLIQCESRVSEPQDEIMAIFEKITEWKKKFGNLDQQKKKVSDKLQPKKNLKIHNVKTLLDTLNDVKQEIGLTEEEVIIIAFTSINREFFTHMII